jgi:hypothetical protein
MQKGAQLHSYFRTGLVQMVPASPKNGLEGTLEET